MDVDNIFLLQHLMCQAAAFYKAVMILYVLYISIYTVLWLQSLNSLY